MRNPVGFFASVVCVSEGLLGNSRLPFGLDQADARPDDPQRQHDKHGRHPTDERLVTPREDAELVGQARRTLGRKEHCFGFKPRRLPLANSDRTSGFVGAFLLQGLQLGDYFEVPGPSGGPLDPDQPFKVEATAFDVERPQQDRMRQQILITTAAGDLAQQIQRTERACRLDFTFRS